jgi:hypothetical protein
VKKDARAGEQTGDGANALRNRTPSFANRSIDGVINSELP